MAESSPILSDPELPRRETASHSRRPYLGRISCLTGGAVLGVVAWRGAPLKRLLPTRPRSGLARTRATPDAVLLAETADDADSWEAEVAALKKQADELRRKREEDLASANNTETRAAKVSRSAAADKARAAELIANASAMQAKANEMMAAAELLRAVAPKNIEEANKLKIMAAGSMTKVQELQGDAEELHDQSDHDLADVKVVTERMSKILSKHRVCVDLPGTRLGPGKGQAFPAIEHDSSMTHSSQCTQRCLETPGCGQAIFSSGSNGCYMSGEASPDPQDFDDLYNSSYCGPKDQKDTMMTMLHGIYAVKPWVPPLVQCSWAGDDCRQNKCCNEVDCDVKFTSCVGYKCYEKTEYFAGCMAQPPPPEWNWKGNVIGGPRERREIEPAPKGVWTQGTTLFCFSVITWDAPAVKPFWATEAALANNMKEHGVSIFQCDGHAFYNGGVTGKAEWGSFSNIDIFRSVWEQVRNDGQWQKYDWTVKVDADAVFIPSRLKQHLDKLRTPRGSRVYLQNIDYQFKFMGALEVVSMQAVKLFLERKEECIRGRHDGGEDFFMKGCMDAIGIDHQTDFELLRDRYCLTCPDEDVLDCTDGWKVAYHFRKKIISWNWCYNEIVCGSKGASCPEGIAVEYMP